jgi:acrylyl-CoA reductase (NADPH)
VRAVLIEKDERGYRSKLTAVDESLLPEGDVTVRVQFSTVNYKDGLAITGAGPVVRKFPMIPGIDFAGIVEHSDSPLFKAGDAVILNGWGVGETRQYARLVSDWIGSVGLDHTKIESTVRYLGIEVDDALAIAEQVDV